MGDPFCPNCHELSRQLAARDKRIEELEGLQALLEYDVKELRQKEFHCLLGIVPFIHPSDPLARDPANEGYFPRDAGGRPATLRSRTQWPELPRRHRAGLRK